MSEVGLVSVVLAVYNGEKYLERQIDSILGQEGVRLELVACDDASTDGSLEILRGYEKRERGRVRVFQRESTIGYVANFESGIREARGDYLALSDQDDVWKLNKLATLRSSLDSGASLAFCDLDVVDEDLRPFGRGMWNEIGFNHSERARFAIDPFCVLLKRNVVSGCGLMVRRDIALASLPFPPLVQFVHDQWLALVASFLGPIVMCPDRLVLYRQHAGQQSGAGLRGSRGLCTGNPRKADWESDWEYLFQRVASLGADPVAIDTAKRHVRERAAVIRRRGQIDSLGDILSLLVRGDYRRHFSGLRSAAKDLARRAAMVGQGRRRVG